MLAHPRQRFPLRLTTVLLLLFAFAFPLSPAIPSEPLSLPHPQPLPADLVLRGATIVDGTGARRRQADVAVRGDRIVAVGSFEVDPKAKVIDVSSLIVAPGFIDLHTHSDPGITEPAKRLNRNYLTQGVTTIVTGNCGLGVLDVAKYLAAIDAHGAGTNVIHLIPHGAVRSAVMGNADRPPSAAELERMKRLVERGMEAGAWGMSSGLIYVPGRYASTAELIELAKVVGRHGGIYASHIRNEGAGLLESIDEAIAIGKGAGVPVHISHLKASGKAYWGTVGPALARIAEARRPGRSSRPTSILTSPRAPSSRRWSSRTGRSGGTPPISRGWPPTRDAARSCGARSSEALDERDGGASIRIARYAPRPDWAGLDLVAIAGREGTTPLEVVLDIQRHGGAQAISFGMSEDDVREVMRHDFVATASDGSTHVPGAGDQPHPRSYGTFPRKIPLRARRQGPLARAGDPLVLGLAGRDPGPSRPRRDPPGAIADIVVFDPATFRDAATFDQPTRYAPGVKYLFVNGEALIAAGKIPVGRARTPSFPAAHCGCTRTGRPT